MNQRFIQKVEVKVDEKLNKLSEKPLAVENNIGI